MELGSKLTLSKKKNEPVTKAIKKGKKKLHAKKSQKIVKF